METITVTLAPLGREIRARKGTPLIDLLHEFGVEFPCGGKGTCGKCSVRLIAGTLSPDPDHQKKLDDLKLSGKWRLACLSRCESDLVIEVEQFGIIIQADETKFAFEPGEGLGAAVDLGTTTLVVQLLDLRTGKVLAVETALNPQLKYGSDLISRLESALKKGTLELRDLIRKTIGRMVTDMMKGRDGKLTRVVIVGNTVMQHLFCGSDIRPLSFYPFESGETGRKQFGSRELGWSIPCDDISFYPSIGSFVGSDILAGILSTGMHRKASHSVLIDLGTNGEIVVGNRDLMLCASTAAGPAFEGARISMGMLARTGAISSMEMKGGEWECRVIGNTDPAGICGSGLIDAVAVLLQLGYLGEFGEILSGASELQLAGSVVLTQKDIQEFQLAKAAIAAGLEILIKRLAIVPDSIDEVFIAGGFGSYINLEHVGRTGMLEFRTDRMHKLGNTALIGAKMFLFSEAGVAESMLGRIRHVNLESEPGFQDLYVDHMKFTAPPLT